ncbi:sensor histidine kinase [Lacrimispora amygdalina]|uniref:histidine kinase n=1 Tax=Lacrimispora amygdalina TaxID=253257 RepID=A0A3E2NDY8_9FIRM|nr:ATP-binding protein [Clostridium indicum]RFZ79237.1 sensor histidine kinase [Clostridium indicum]
MKGIKKRLFLNYLIGVCLVLFSVELIFMISIKNYYYKSVEQSLNEKAQSSATLYNQYLNKNYANLSDSLAPLVENNTEQQNIEIQIIDKKGNVLLSSGIVSAEKIQTNDFQKALKGEVSTWTGNNIDTNEKVMSASSAIKDLDSNTIAVIRVVTSLEDVNNLTLKYLFLSVTLLIVILICIFISSTILSKTIIEPVKEVNDIARKMSKGQFNERINKHYNDEIGELSDTLNYMASEILKAEETKNDFISSVSHELRTPLTAIKGWGETILTGSFEDKEEIEKGLKVILRETDRLKNMVDELLDFSKLEGNKLVLNKEKTDIKEEIEEILRLYDGRAIKERISLQTKFTENIPELSVDRNRFKQVIINILDNAMKFSPKDSNILINVSTLENELIIEIIDNGYGIAKEDLPKIKDKFFKGNSKKSGSGIGLAVCDKIIKLHGGSLELKSELNKGTNVIIKLRINEIDERKYFVT